MDQRRQGAGVRTQRCGDGWKPRRHLWRHARHADKLGALARAAARRGGEDVSSVLERGNAKRRRGDVRAADGRLLHSHDAEAAIPQLQHT
jgi:hypothetical protein